MDRHLSLIVAGMLLGLVAVVPLSAQSGNSSDSLGSAQINRIINDVFTVEDIRKEKPRVHPSNEGEVIGQYHALRTAEQSRAELKFEDGSVARVGSDAFFSFASNSRDVQMGKGTALFQVPKNSEETNIQTATATASLTGTTVMVNQQPDRHVKTAVIEGSVDVSMPDRVGESRTLEAGQMIVMPTDAERLPEPVDVDLQELVSTSGLINDFDEEEEEDASEGDEEASTETDEGDETSESTDEADETTETTDESAEPTSETDQASESPEDASSGEQDQSSSLNVDQMSEGIEQQQEEIESGELEETNIVIDGEGTEVTVEDEETLETETTTDDSKDAIEQNSDDQTTLALDGTKEVYFGTDNDEDPPTADGLEGEIITPTFSSTGDGLSSGVEDQELLESALAFLNGGVETALFEPDVIEVDGEPTVQSTEFVQDVAFYARETVNFNVDQLVIDGDQASLGIGAGAHDYRLDLPNLNIQTPTQFGAITVGDGSELRFGNVQAPGSFVTGFSRNTLSAASGANLSAGSLQFFTLSGPINFDNNTGEANQLILQGLTAGSSLSIANGSDIRTVDPSGAVNYNGGEVASITDSRIGYYDPSVGAYDATSGQVRFGFMSSENTQFNVTSSEFKAGEINFLVGNTVSVQDSILSAKNGSVSPTLSVSGDLSADGSIMETATTMQVGSTSGSGQVHSLTNGSQLRTLSTSGSVQLSGGGGDIIIQDSSLGYYDESISDYNENAGAIQLRSNSPDNDGNIDISGSKTELEAGEINFDVGTGDVSIQDGDLIAGNGSVQPTVGGFGDLSTTNALVETANTLEWSSSTTSGQSFSITNSTELKTLSEFGGISLLSDGGDMEVVDSRMGYDDGTSFSAAGGRIVMDSQNPDASATIRFDNSADLSTFDPANTNLMARTIKSRAMGSNGEIRINGTFMAASKVIKMYAPQGRVRFTGNSRLDLGGVADAMLAGNTVRVDNGVEVTVSNRDVSPAVFANNYYYGRQSEPAPNQCADGTQCGKFVDVNGNKISIQELPLSDRPSFY